MFKHYKDLCDVVSLMVFCPHDRTYLSTKDGSGETWLPSIKCEKNCWKVTAHKIYFSLFGVDSGNSCHPIRVYKVWLPNHALPCAYHAVYKAAVKADVKKRLKNKAGLRSRLLWLSAAELERQRAHSCLRSPEILVFSLMVFGEGRDLDKDTELESGALVEICEENVVVGMDVAGGAVAMASPNMQLLNAAGYTREDQIRLYREFVLMVFPAIYMSVHMFSQFMIDIGWQRSQCSSLFRAADVSGRGGLSFLELMLWTAALEPGTQHVGLPAEIRCRYIFRYFDNNRDQKLEYVEFKELVAAARAARQLPIDALSVARDADICLKQLGLQPNSQLPLAEFLRGVSELKLRGTSSLLRSPRSVAAYVMDLQQRENEVPASTSATSKLHHVSVSGPGLCAADSGSHASTPGPASAQRVRADYCVATYTVRMRRRPPNEFIELHNFDEDTVSPSTAQLLLHDVRSSDLLGASCMPTEAFAAVHYFASVVDKPQTVRGEPSGSTQSMLKPAWSWLSPAEEGALGALLLRLAELVRPICAGEPRLLRLASPVYAIGDLHGNLSALLSMESALWPSGTALAATRILFLGDYVDRGVHGAELMAYLLAAKLQRPNAVLLIRGNHEIRDIQKMFTFYSECINKYGEIEGMKIWNAINNVFDCLPLAAVIDDKVFCCHGGLPPPWVCPVITAIDKVPVPLPRPAEQSSIAWELLWNDPVKLVYSTWMITRCSSPWVCDHRHRQGAGAAAAPGGAELHRVGAAVERPRQVPVPLPRPAEQSSIAWELLWNDPVKLVYSTWMITRCSSPWVCDHRHRQGAGAAAAPGGAELHRVGAAVERPRQVPVPLPRPAEQSSIAWELLWNDPVKPNKITASVQLELASNEGFAANSKRGTGHVFDQTALDRFLTANQLSHVVRAHELHQNGFMCQLRGRLISVFSSYHYCGGTNDCGVALVEDGKLRLMRINVSD
ncbi:hypothetical protein PYW07_001384 [Mythimna separata]|uniref:Serine/threonine-protein phosphatase n=1 Tax=Mythimna separata TaxID=271217 RepID=A0AAD8DVT8_MYTSE|nr:hypothetical protein PYW07_001384 [Mythimna separata]